MKVKKDANWKEVPLGGIIPEAGTSDEYETGSWRTYRPTHDAGKCINCLRCWIMCPDSAIQVKDGKVTGIDYKHCKGCGICAFECPPKVKAITMSLGAEPLGPEPEKK
ncbi:MAG TPA: 4Fe-4S binding protein [Planctomycetota bacterium]|nr:4Fe-4S binding protein [Planctomycetota bacterium]